MTSIVYQDRASGSMFLYQPKYPAQRSLFEQKRTERVLTALEELRHVGNINIFLFKNYFIIDILYCLSYKFFIFLLLFFLKNP